MMFYVIIGEDRAGTLDKRLAVRPDHVARLQALQGEGRLLILCDSYANAIAPMLSASYARIDLVDPRYFSGDLAALAQEAQPNAMLAIFGLNTLTTNRSILLMDVPERSTVE